MEPAAALDAVCSPLAWGPWRCSWAAGKQCGSSKITDRAVRYGSSLSVLLIGASVVHTLMLVVSGEPLRVLKQLSKGSPSACSSGGGDGSGQLVRHLVNYQQVMMGGWALPKLNSLVKEHPPGAAVTLRGKVSQRSPGGRQLACDLCEVAALRQRLDP